MLWTKQGSCTDFKSYVKEKTGVSFNDFVEASGPFKIPGDFANASGMIQNAVRDGRRILVFADYDVDGICSGAEMCILLRALGAKFMIHIPKRMSEGYGLSTSILDNAEPGSLLITVDNGINAHDAVRAAKARGLDVIILDHHELEGVPEGAASPDKCDCLHVPAADIIIDPSVWTEGFDCTNYCGAGLVLKLSELMLQNVPDSQMALDSIRSLAAVATVGDSVDVRSENRAIVLQGLDLMERGMAQEGLSSMLELLRTKQVLSSSHIVTTKDIGFAIAPMINAPGRLFDNGGVQVEAALFEKDPAKRMARMEKLYEINEQRKSLVKQFAETCNPKGRKIVFLYDESIPQGICGIIAGRLAEQMHKPAFVLAKTEGDRLKGSARAPEGVSLTEIIAAASPVVSGGGHAQAAGFECAAGDEEKAFALLEENAPEPGAENERYYDFELGSASLFQAYLDFAKIRYFGPGLPVPVMKMLVSPDNVQISGKDKTHIRFRYANLDFVGFSLAAKYESLGKPSAFHIYGKFDWNTFRGEQKIQIEVCDLESA